MNGAIKRKGKSEWRFPFLMEKTGRKPLSLTVDEMGRLAGSWSLSTRGTRVLRSYDACGHHGGVGRLTFSM